MLQHCDFLFINPWIYDFAAYDFWLKPFGLLSFAGKLKQKGYTIYYLDLLDPFHPELPKKPKRNSFGRGHFYKEPFPKPSLFIDVPRRFFRYGLPFAAFEKEVLNIKFKAVFITTLLTYWYPGLFVYLEFHKKHFPQIPLFIGGIYAILCKDHLLTYIERFYKDLSIFIIFPQKTSEILQKIEKEFIPSGSPEEISYPAFYLQRKIPYVVIMTSKGCPYNCPYCASKKIYPLFEERSAEDIFQEIEFWYKNFGVKDFAFYDDALLVNFDKRLRPVLERIIEKQWEIRFHTPNAIHARLVTEEVTHLLKKSGFKTIRLGFERAEKRLDSKISLQEFEEAVVNLKKAGFSSDELGAYVLYGLPDEDFEGVKQTLLYLEKLGVPPYLAEFSPIPGTPLFEEAKKTSRYPLEEDPIFQNNTVFPALKNPDWQKIQEVKDLARGIRKSLFNRKPF